MLLGDNAGIIPIKRVESLAQHAIQLFSHRGLSW
jgi:hypothetical protein